MRRENRHSSICVLDLEGMTCRTVHLRDLSLFASEARTRAEAVAEADRLLAAIARDGAVSLSTELGEPCGLLFAPPGLPPGQVVLCVPEDVAKEVGL